MIEVSGLVKHYGKIKVALCTDCGVTIRKSNIEDVLIKLTGERIE